MDISDRIWPLAIVGRGSTAAYYLCHIDLADYAGILAVGEDDAWAGKRGYSGNATDPTLKINQPLHLLAHLSETIPEYSTELVDRLDWARRNEDVLRRCTMAIHQATVTKISEAPLPANLVPDGGPGLFGFKIDMAWSGANPTPSVYAYKVVVCAGTGGHRVPDPLKVARKSFPKQVLDLDEFAKLSGRELNPQTRVIVIGANAAIDAVHKALNYGCKIDWLIELAAPTKPAMLATQPLMLEAWNDAQKAQYSPNLYRQTHRLTVYRYSKYEFRHGPGESTSAMLLLRVTFRDGATTGNAMGNYIAYGIGPDGASTGMIANAIQAKLKPISDSTRALNSDPRKPATILGYEAEGTGLRTGLEVFGAMSGAIGREIDSSKDRMTVLEKQINEYRKTYRIFDAVQNAGFAFKPFFLRSLKDLAKEPRSGLHARLQSELKRIVDANSGEPRLRSALEALANQILAYHTAAAYRALGDRDPNSLKNFRNLLNQVATNLPQGAVGDHGQLTSINAALGAYATMRGNLPKYMPQQQYDMRGPQKKGAELDFVEVKTVQGNINYNLDNAQNLAIYICVTFPNIPPHEANDFVDEVMRKRHASNIGFTDAEALKFKERLWSMELNALVEQARSLSNR
jgi:hypothetical protein